MKTPTLPRAASLFLALLIPRFTTNDTCHGQNKSCIKVKDNITDLQVSIHDIKLHCKQDTYLALAWYSNSTDQSYNLTYLVEVSTVEPSNNWINSLVEDSTFAVVYGLNESTSYIFRITPLLSNISVGTGSVSDPFTTLDGNMIPAPIENISVSSERVSENSIDAVLNWSPSKDSICCTEMIFWQSGSNHIRNTEIEVRNLYSYPLTGLMFGETYTVSLYNVVRDQEGSHVLYNFTTPSCLEITENNLFKCAPNPPQNLTFMMKNCKAVIMWNPPDVQPLYYNVMVSHEKAFSDTLYELPANTTKFEMETLNFGSYLAISVSAIGPAGHSEESVIRLKNKCIIKTNPELLISGLIEKRVMIVTFMIVILFFVFATLVITYYIILPSKSKKRIEIFNEAIPSSKEDYINDIHVAIKTIDDDEFEVSPNSVYICQLLGEGEFGVVYKAIYTRKDGQTEPVAVKMLREKASNEEKRQLQKEMELMKSVGNHKNIVSLVGCCTSKMMLIVEYCSLGDLHNFLRQASKKILTNQNMSSSNALPNNLSFLRSNHQGLLAVSNMLYDRPDLEKTIQNLSYLDLLSFARQIATGMTYLSENHVIHRDLAARNILVCDGMMVKISDFGLSRDLYESSVYRKNSSDRLPLKWMALESLMYQVYSTKSDVWSFGVLLWEIVTLGGCPYPSIPSDRMFRLLQEGYRMEQPSFCSDKLYEIMLSCWDAQPHSRPSFPQLVDQLEILMQEESNCNYLCLTP